MGKFGSIWLFIGPNPELFSKFSHFKEILKQRNTNNKNKTIVLIAINKIYLNKNAKYDWMSSMFKSCMKFNAIIKININNNEDIFLRSIVLTFYFCHLKCLQKPNYNISVMNKININKFNFMNHNNMGVLSKTLNLHFFWPDNLYSLYIL